MDHIKLKIFCTMKETSTKTKISLVNRRSYLQTVYKGLISKIYKEFIQLNIKKTQPYLKSGQRT